VKFFLDTANLDEIREAKKLGLIDGVTTNPTLLAKEGKDWKTQAKLICQEVDGPVSLEVVSLDAEGMIKEAQELVKFGPNVVIKVPITLEGLKAVKALEEMGIPTNVTLVFSPAQALLAAKAGASYVSPFVGRLDDISSEGMNLVEQILQIYTNYDIKTQVIVASIRNPEHVRIAALMGAHIATIPFKVYKQLVSHPLTDIGLKRFLDDWKKIA